ncbi:MAG: helix-turn-helix domain-containing protein [Bacteroidales bacterium]
MSYERDPITDILSRFINTTNQCIFLTGKAGTGKTTFLRQMSHTTHKHVIIAAPTGIAAINAGGVTLHSLFQLPFGAYIPNCNGLNGLETISVAVNTPNTLMKNLKMHQNKRRLLQQMELLVIDEVSMLRADLLDAIDHTLRRVRKEHRYPFGGVQVLFIGDLLQLPPVVKDDEWGMLSKYYQSPYFFSAQVLKEAQLQYVELEKIYRQSDERFIGLLSHLRNNKITDADIELLNQFYQPDYQQKVDDGVVLLTTHNYIADAKNSSTLAILEGEEKVFRASVSGDFNAYNYPAEEQLHLKKGAQVMFIKNDYSGSQLYFNGKIGHVASFDDDEITVEFSDGSPDATVSVYTWENKKYVLNKNNNEIEESVVGTFQQYPLKLAWAITVHKSQGLTFDKAIIDVNRAFAPGQIYVALSRLRSIEGLILTSRIPSEGIPISSSIETFAQQKKSKRELLPILQQAADNYLQSFCMHAYDFSSLMQELRYHLESYNKAENRSEKQKHKDWATSIYDQTEPLRQVGNGFCKQMHQIMLRKSEGHLNELRVRIEKSIGYFEPLIRKLHDELQGKMKELKGQRGVKAFQTELDNIAGQYLSILQQMYKAKSLLQATIAGEELGKASVDKPELFRSDAAPNAGRKKKSKKKKTEKIAREAKDAKVPSHEISYELFQQGKNIEEIATERGLVGSTIESHLARYVEWGKIDLSELMDEAKMQTIEQAIDAIDGEQLTPIKEMLSNDYSYGDIRMVLAHRKYLEQKGE